MAASPGPLRPFAACSGWERNGAASRGLQLNGARPIKDGTSAPGTGALIVAPGVFPARTNTVIAEVLANLIAGERLTGLEAVFDAGTTRLASHIHRLEAEYMWSIGRDELMVRCKDGRVANVTAYRLLPGTIERAMTAGAEEWCAAVRDARARRRVEAASSLASRSADHG